MKACLTFGVSERKENTLITIDDNAAVIWSEYFPNTIYCYGFYKKVDIYCSTQSGRIIDNGMWPDKRFHSARWMAEVWGKTDVMNSAIIQG